MKGLIQTGDAVLRAIKECDKLGRKQFLEQYGFRPAKHYFLIHNGKKYDSKAIVGVAYGFENPEHGPLKPSEFSGGAASVQSWLKYLNFQVKKLPDKGASKPEKPKKKVKHGSKVLGVDASNINEVCRALHRYLNALPMFSFPFPVKSIPLNGIYVLFEDGEQAHGAARIVRVGTHTGKNQLRSRLKEHFLIENKDRSIFRKHIGRCLLNRDKDPFLAMWELDLTKNEAKKQYAGKIDFEKQKKVEQRVSKYIQTHCQYVVFEVSEKAQRLKLESRLVSTISLCTGCCASQHWLGLHSPNKKIRESGLWQVQELYKTAFSSDELQTLVDCLQSTS